MNFFDRKIPNIDETLADFWILSDDDKLEANNTIEVLNQLARSNSADDTLFNIMEIETPDDFQPLAGTRDFFASYSWYSELEPELKNNVLMKECRKYTREVIILTAFSEVNLKKSYIIADAFVGALNSNNIFSAAILLRSYFEIVGSFINLTREAGLDCAEAKDIDSISTIVDHLMHRRNEFFEDTDFVKKTKEAIGRDIDDGCEKSKSKFGHRLYAYLCNFVHPNYLSNEQILQFYTEEFGYGHPLDYFDVKKKADFFSIGIDFLSHLHFQILVRGFTILTSLLHNNCRRITKIGQLRISIGAVEGMVELLPAQDRDKLDVTALEQLKIVRESLTLDKGSSFSPLSLINAAKQSKRQDITDVVFTELQRFNDYYNDYADHILEIDSLVNERLNNIAHRLSEQVIYVEKLSQR